MTRAKDAYRKGTEHQFRSEPFELGPWSSLSMRTDPRHILFTLARYKFSAKMCEGLDNVMEVGPGDGIGSPVLAQVVGNLHSFDWDSRLTEGNKNRLKDFNNIFHVHRDFNKEKYSEGFADAAVLIDVIEHIDPYYENRFMDNVVYSLHENGIIIVGTPNLTAAKYQSPQSEAQHINLKTSASLKAMVAKYFKNVFMFGQNDEVVHCGFAPMCHYIWALGVGIR